MNETVCGKGKCCHTKPDLAIRFAPIQTILRLIESQRIVAIALINSDSHKRLYHSIEVLSIYAYSSEASSTSGFNSAPEGAYKLTPAKS